MSDDGEETDRDRAEKYYKFGKMSSSSSQSPSPSKRASSASESSYSPMIALMKQRCLSLNKLTSSIAKRDAEVSEAKTENQKLQEEVARLTKELEDKTKQLSTIPRPPDLTSRSTQTVPEIALKTAEAGVQTEAPAAQRSPQRGKAKAARRRRSTLSTSSSGSSLDSSPHRKDANATKRRRALSTSSSGSSTSLFEDSFSENESSKKKVQKQKAKSVSSSPFLVPPPPQPQTQEQARPQSQPQPKDGRSPKPRIPFFAMMKKRPQRKTPVAKFNTNYSFSCTSELTNRAAEAASEAARFLPVSLAYDWDTVENADEQLETWKPKRTPTSAKGKKSSSSPWKLKVKLRATQSEEANKSKASPKKVNKEKQKKKKKKERRPSMADSSSEGQSPKKSVVEKSRRLADSSSEGQSPKKSVVEKSSTESVKEGPSPKKKASSSTSGEETPKRVIIPEKLFALGAKRPSTGEDGGKQKSYDIAAIKRSLLEQQKSGPPPKKHAVAEKTPNPTRPFGRLPGSLLAESAGGSVRPVKRRVAYEPKMKFVKASSAAGGADAGLSGLGAGGAPGKPCETSSMPHEPEETPMEITRAAVATSSESEVEYAEKRPTSPKPLLSTFSPSTEREKSVNSAAKRVGQPFNSQPNKPTSTSGILALGGNNTTCHRVIDKPLSQTTGSGGTINQEREVEIATAVENAEPSSPQSSTPPRVPPCDPPRREEKEEEMKAPSDKEDVLSQQSTEVDTDVQTDVESAIAEQQPLPRDKVGSEPEKANKVQGSELGKKVSQSTTNFADEEEEKSLLEDLYLKFNSQHAIKTSILVKRIAEYNESNLTREINENVLKSQLGRLWKTCSASVFANIVVQLTKPDYASCHRKMFCDVLFQAIKTEKPNPEKDYEFCDRGLPMLTNKQIKVLALLDALSRTEVMADVCTSFANYLYYALFGVRRIYLMPQFNSINLVRFYIVLMRQGGLEEKCRLFLFDMLFFKSARNHIFVCVMIEVWPEILSWPHYAHLPHQRSVIDPIVETVVWMINNTGPANSLRDLMVYEARNRLVQRCNVRFPVLDGKELVRKLLHQVQNSPKDEVFKASTTMGLMLLGKWMEWRWTNNNISFQLLSMLGKCFNAGDTQLLPWVIETLGFVSRVYPVDGREHLSSLFDQIKVVITSEMITEPLERICCLALIRVGHHLQLQVAKFLAQWRPKFPLDPEVEKIMWNFVGTRGKNFSQKTINYHKRGKIYAKMNAPAMRRAST